MVELFISFLGTIFVRIQFNNLFVHIDKLKEISPEHKLSWDIFEDCLYFIILIAIYLIIAILKFLHNHLEIKKDRI